MVKKRKAIPKKKRKTADLVFHYLEKIISVAMALFVLSALAYAFYHVMFTWL